MTESETHSEAQKPDDQGESESASPETTAKPVVQRTAMRPAGSVEDVRRSIMLGSSLGLLSVYLGIRCIQWALVRFLTGGSSTVLALTVLLPFAAPMLISSVLINRGKKTIGMAMGAGVLFGILMAGVYFFLLHHEPAAFQARPASPMSVAP